MSNRIEGEKIRCEKEQRITCQQYNKKRKEVKRGK